MNDVSITWYKDSTVLEYSSNDRVVSLDGGELEIVRLQPQDSGVYECEVKRVSDGDHGPRVVRATSIDVVKPRAGTLLVQIHVMLYRLLRKNNGTPMSAVCMFAHISFAEEEIPDSCIDKPFYADCKLIVRASLCSHPYYSDYCCHTCKKAGLLRRRRRRRL